jgi:alpha-glucosidase
VTDHAGQHSNDEWWRTAVIYQVYPRSFADASGDGIGDLPGITARLDHLAYLGVDAVWLSPFYTSPQRDAGYDVADYCDVDPVFGTLADFDALLARAHELHLKVIVDIVPNHCSSDHVWFQEALAAAPGSPERARFMFREGSGPDGAEPPNNWESVFGGPAWTRTVGPDGTPGQWYLHLFDSSQPDFDWSNPWVADRFDEVLRFWLDRGVDGFRVDVAHGMVKAPGLPDLAPKNPNALGDPMAHTDRTAHPHWAQEGVHDICRRWRRVLEEYGPDRVLVAEAWVEPLEHAAKWVRHDEMHQAFNFEYLLSPWDARALRKVIDGSLAAFNSVGAPATWVLSNHDTIRHTSRLALTTQPPHGDGIGPASAELPDPVVGLRRARAATLLMLALPGSAYLYQGEELGLPEVIDIPDHQRQDPTFRRTAGQRYGRDGCRVPLPWDADAPAYGFSPTGASWLPQPQDWGLLAAQSQRAVSESTLEMYRRALQVRKRHHLGAASLAWDEVNSGLLSFSVGDVTVISNFSDRTVPMPTGSVLITSSPAIEVLEPDTTAWVIVQ